MTDSKEFERDDLRIDNDMQVDCDIGEEITCYIEAWCDTADKFGIDLQDGDDTWVNLYGKYNPYKDTLRMECEICHDDAKTESFDYTVTPSEAMLIKVLIAEKIMQFYGQTPTEFCESARQQADTQESSEKETVTMGGM